MRKAAEVAVELIDSFHDNMLFGLSEGMLSPDEAVQRWVHGFTVGEVGAALRFVQTASRRELRRARKARKNLVMYKLAGRRPWTDNNGVLYSSKAGVERMAQNGDDALSIAARYRNGPKLHMHHRQLHLRERTGFLAMSRLATWMTGKEGEAAVREAVIEESKRWRK